MNSAKPPRIQSKIGTATAAAALIALSALIVPTQAVATPTPLNTPDCAIDSARTFCQATYTTSPTTDTEPCDWSDSDWRDRRDWRNDRSRYEDECGYSSDIPW